jgi:hypothetical protein
LIFGLVFGELLGVYPLKEDRNLLAEDRLSKKWYQRVSVDFNYPDGHVAFGQRVSID